MAAEEMKSSCDWQGRKLILRLYEEIPSTPAAVDRVTEKILRVARTMGCARGELPKVELALREALVNAIVHGHRGDRRKKVAVCCLCAADRGMLLMVQDAGVGFDPSTIPDPTDGENVYASHGRGIFLMRRLMDEVRFEDKGRRVVMKKAARR